MSMTFSLSSILPLQSSNFSNQERRIIVAEGLKKIEEEKALCAKAIEHVSQTREALIGDVKLERFIE